eukprot:6490610-Amphidinium_carterae.2
MKKYNKQRKKVGRSTATVLQIVGSGGAAHTACSSHEDRSSHTASGTAHTACSSHEDRSSHMTQTLYVHFRATHKDRACGAEDEEQALSCMHTHPTTSRSETYLGHTVELD